MDNTARAKKIAFVGDYVPRKCGIATFTADLLGAVADAHPRTQCFSVSVNDLVTGYDSQMRAAPARVGAHHSYGLADHSTGFATVPVADVLQAMV